MPQAVIALDQGSSSSRALAVDERGRVLARAQFPVKAFHPRPGFVEHDAEELARTTERALDAVLDRLPSRVEVLGLGLAAQRSTVVLWDAKTGRPAARAPSWMDGRAAALVAPLQERQKEVHERTGLYLTPYYSAPKIRWLLDHEPKARALAEEGRLRAGPVSTYLLWRLTRGAAFKSDPAMAQRTLLCGARTGAWDDAMLAMFNIPRAMLPDIVPTTGPWGELRRKRRRLPVLAVLGDQQAAALGQGGGEPGRGVLNYGTGAFFLLHTGESLPHVPGLLTSVAWQRPGRGMSYFLEGTVHAAGTSLQWLKRGLGVLKDVRSVDKACRRSTHRVWALPAIGGLGAPRWDYRTPAAFYGLASKTRSEDLVRGVVEAIAFLMADIVAAARAAGFSAEELRASGGLANIPYLLQFQSDLLGRPISRLAEGEATALGVASMAAEAAGAPWAFELRSGRADRAFKPAVERPDAERLLSGWRRFVESQQALARDLSGLGL